MANSLVPPPPGVGSGRLGGVKVPGPPTSPSGKLAGKAKSSGGGGGIGGLFSEAGHLVTGLASGLGGLAKSGAKEAWGSTKASYRVAGDLVTGHPNKALTDAQNYANVAAATTAAGAAQGFTGKPYEVTVGRGSGATPSDFDLTGQQFGSFGRTAGDAAHPSRFVTAYHQGHLLGKLVEDAANVALVAGAGSTALNAASRGAFADAATARATATAADAEVGAAAKAASEAAGQAAQHASAVDAIDQAIAKAPRPALPTLQAQRDAAVSIASDAQNAAEKAAQTYSDAQTRAATAHSSADDLASSAGPGYRVYRAAHAVSKLGGQGAALPAKPFELGLKVLGGGWSKLLAANPALRDSLSTFDDSVGEYEGAQAAQAKPSLLQRGVNKASQAANDVQERVTNSRLTRGFSAKVAGINARAETTATGYNRALDAMAKAGVDDPVLAQAALADRAGIGHAILAPVEILGEGAQALPQGAVDELMGRLASTMGYQPEALKLAVDIAKGTADPAVVAKVRAAQDIWSQRVAPSLERDITTDTRGLRQNPTPEQQALAEWNTAHPGSAELPPNAGPQVAAKADKRLGRLQRELDARAKTMHDQAAKLGITPGEAGRQGARSAAAASVEGTTGRGALGALRDVQGAARAEGRATVARSAAERLAAIRDSVPASVPDEIVQRVVDAGDRFRQAQGQLVDAATTPEGAMLTTGAEAEGQARAQYGAIVDEVRNVRQAAVGLATQELRALSDLPEHVPFVPGDLSEHHAYLHEQVGGAETNIRPILDELSSAKGAAGRYPTREALWQAAYDRLWRRLPPAVRNAVDKLTSDQVAELARRDAAGTTTAFEGGLDTMAEEYLGRRASGDPHADAQAFLDDVARRGRLRAFIAGARANRWGPGMVDRLAGGVSDAQGLADLMADPATRAALEGNRMADVAAELAQSRAGAAAGPVSFPTGQALQDAAGAGGFPTDENGLLGVVERAYGDPAAFDRFYQAWDQSGRPDLQGAVENAVGFDEPPSWLAAAPQNAELAAEPGSAGALGALRQAEQARADIGEAVATGGGQGVRGPLGSEVGRLKAAATQGEKVAAGAPEAESRLVGKLAEQGAQKGVKAGRLYERYVTNLRKLDLAQSRIEQMPEWMAGEFDKMYRELKNQPAYARPAVKVARDFANVLGEWRAEMTAPGEDGAVPRMDPAVLGVVDRAMQASIRDVRDIYNVHVAGPTGELTTHPTFEPEYVPGGQPLGKAKGTPPPGAGRLRVGPAREENLKQTARFPRSVPEAKEVLRQRVWTHARNEAARMVQSDYGQRAAAVLGTTEGMTGEQVAAAMREQGFVPWDARQLIQRVRPNEVGPATLFIPEPIMRQIENFYSPGGRLEQFMRRYYDRPVTTWKAVTLALRPAWHVNTILGGALMTMVGTGMSPVEYAGRIQQAYALIHAADEGGLSERMAGRLESINPQARASLTNEEGTILPPDRLMQRRAGAAAAQVSDLGAGKGLTSELDSITGDVGKLRSFVNKSYSLNGAVHDVHRVAAFLTEYDKLSDADLSHMAARHSELLGLSPSEIRREGAVRIALSVGGDFLRMTSLERQVFRRIIPFYTWMRHMTQLAIRLPVFSPARTAWLLNISSLYGSPSGYGLQGTVPLGSGDLLQLPSINPFRSVTSFAPGDIGFNLSPAIKLPVGALTGLNLDTMGQFQRPPGQPGGYGGAPGAYSPLFHGRLGELANLVGSETPAFSSLRSLADVAQYGEPVMHYPLGEVRRTPKTQGSTPVPSGQPKLGGLAQFLGVPYVRRPNRYEKQDLDAWRKARLAGRIPPQ